MSTPVIQVENLVKRYQELVALDHFNLEIEEGEIFGLLGPNGSGKTTTMNCILSLLSYDKGSIKVFGKGSKERVVFFGSYAYDAIKKYLSKRDFNNEYLVLNKKALLKRSNEKDTNKYWYAFGRSQAINDTYTDKLTINALLRTKEDWKFTLAKKGVGVYGGLYIISDTISYDKIKETLRSDEFV